MIQPVVAAPAQSTLLPAPRARLVNNIKGIDKFDLPNAKFDATALKYKEFTNSAFEITSTYPPELDAQIAMIFLFNALQFTVSLFMANYPPNSKEMNNLYSLFNDYDPQTKPILITNEQFKELRNVKEYFKRKPLTATGLTMLDVRNLIVKAKPYMAVRHYASKTIVKHGPVDRDNITLISAKKMMEVLSVPIKWQGIGFLAFVEPSVIWPKFVGDGHMVAAVAAVDHDDVLIFPSQFDLPRVWVKADVLYQSMVKLDSRDQKPRGLIEISLNLP